MTIHPALSDFGGFYARTYPMAYRTALGICREGPMAEEATQDAFLAAWRERERYRGDGPPDAWLLRIVVNSAITVLRRRRVRRAEPLTEEVGQAEQRVPDPAESIAVRQVLDALDGRHRAAVVLRYYHDLDYASIATILGTSTGNVGSMLSRALARMRVELAEDGPPLPGAAATPLEVAHDR
ncbi:MAG: sigma-70 family RNA polymerase sigma factor [Chloroflexi bacterium]|nr:sigma-70 family RNA polymerase sigma factor [Chloroflexota bacterium]